MKRYYPLLDIVRFFAAFWVMNYHYLFGLGNNNEISWYRYGNLGVQLFFIISGFVIIQSLSTHTLPQFIKNRFIRLFPLFWITCTLTFIISHVIPHTSNLGWREYLVSMTMLGDIIHEVRGYGLLIDPSYWTLTVELIFYISICLYVYICSKQTIRYFLALWLAWSMLTFALHIDHDFYVKLTLVRHASYFIFGGTLALITLRHATTLFQKYFDYTLLCLSALYGTLIHSRAIPIYEIPNIHDFSIVTILHVFFFIGIPILVYQSYKVTQTRTVYWCVILGGITYPLYLLHQKIGNASINFITNTFDTPWTVTAILFEVFIVCIAYVLFVRDKKIRLLLHSKLDTITKKVS